MEVLLKKLTDAEARFVVIGGQAMLQEGMPRFTLDWDLFIPPRDKANFEKINRAWLMNLIWSLSRSIP